MWASEVYMEWGGWWWAVPTVREGKTRRRIMGMFHAVHVFGRVLDLAALEEKQEADLLEEVVEEWALVCLGRHLEVRQVDLEVG